MFCSKCGRQINNDALFCTFCGSPTMLSAPSAPAAPNASGTTAVSDVPVPRSIPMSSENYAANAGSVSMPFGAPLASVPLRAPEYGAEPFPAEESVNGAPEDTAPTAESYSSEGGEAAEYSSPMTYDSAEPSPFGESASPQAEQPAVSAPVQTRPVFAAQESAAPELSTVGAAGIVPDFSASVQIAPPTEGSGKPVKYYTFGHIALCLAAVGVMAIVAGIFAGLYFSVI